MIWIVIMLVVGLFLSAFFSGSETGFYRATRTRLALDAMSGDRTSRGLIWFTNNPALFVATTLVGNNLANYLTSGAIVWGTSMIWAQHTDGLDLLISILMTPIIFVYGELMPKNLFFRAPNRLLRLAGPLFLFFAVVFAPLAAILWGLGRLLESIVGESPERLQLRLVRSELKRVLSEGHEAGVLAPTQRQMADGMFEVTTRPLDRYYQPMSRLSVVRRSMSKQEMLRIARRRQASVLFVQDQRRELIGYYHVVDLHLGEKDSLVPNAIPRISRREPTIVVLTSLQKADEPFAAIVGDNGRIIGIVDVRQLAQSILNSQRSTY